MARAESSSSQRTIPAAVHDFLSENGKKGGHTTQQLIEMGKRYAKEHNIELSDEFESDVEREDYSRSSARRQNQ